MEAVAAMLAEGMWLAAIVGIIVTIWQYDIRER